LDIGTIIGIVVGLALVVGSILMKGTITAFVDVASLLIVIGGTFAASCVAFPLGSVFSAIKAALSIFFQVKIDHLNTVRTLLKAADLVRKNGPVALEKADSENEFMRTSLIWWQMDTVRRISARY
jgi:chemotaxis protein MotA